jgi:tRNA (guanine-N7-)-methyltransferase
MAGKQKLIRFEQMNSFPNVVEPSLEEILVEEKSGKFKDHPLKGNWHSNFFKNDKPLVLELGCGKGEYSVGMGRRFPGKNFLGVDIKGARMWNGASRALDEGLANIGFLRTRIDFITSFFSPGEVDEIWITFPDPQKEGRRERKRLTSPMFIERYREILKPGGIVHLKTDSPELYEYTMEQIQEHGYGLIQATDNLYGELVNGLDEDTQAILNIRTHYEGIFSAKGFSIKYIKFRISA